MRKQEGSWKNDDDKASATPPNGRRKRLLALLIGLFLAAGIGYGIYWALVGRYVESTDDAYVGGNLVQITPQVSGTVLAIDADDTDYVKAGQTLVALDQADSRIALEEAEAALARRRAPGAQSHGHYRRRSRPPWRCAKPNWRARARTSRGARRWRPAAPCPPRNCSTRAMPWRAAGPRCDVAEQQLAAQQTLTDHTTVETHPEVQSAAARVREAYLAYARTAMPAPVSGIVAKRSVQVGQRVSPGMPLMAVMPLDQVWVDANFKERQLRDLRIGQPVKLTADLYGSAVEFHGRVVGLGAGTGSAFALLPAQNATGNWIKVVQRVPVRIALDPAEIAEHPLRVGLSMLVDVDTHQRGGEPQSKSARTAPAYQAKAFSSLTELADRRIAAIIAANGGNAGAARRAAKAAAEALRPKSGAH